MPVFNLLSKIYGAAARAKNWSYDHHVMDAVRICKQVVSVGNLTVGGTGKTPVVDFLLTECEKRKLKALVVSRNYKSKIKDTAKVDLGHPQGAYYFGDEPFLLLEKHPSAQVVVGPEKWKSALWAEQNCQFDILIVDDGFQHRNLHRDLDIVLVDASQPWEHYQLLPKGRAREDWSGLQRAHQVILTKVPTETVTENETSHSNDDLAKIRMQLQSLNTTLDSSESSALAKPVTSSLAEMNYDLIFPVPAATTVVGFCGLGNPSSFQKSLMGFYKENLKGFLEFPDHHNYNLKDIQHLQDLLQQHQAEWLVTTEKDLVKIKSLLGKTDRILAVPIQLNWKVMPKVVYEFLDQVRSV